MVMGVELVTAVVSVERLTELDTDNRVCDIFGGYLWDELSAKSV